MDKKYSVYSLADVKTTINHPDVGRCVLSDAGGGRITISDAGDIATMTRTATGYPIINKLRSEDGSCSVEVPQNSDADEFMRRWVKYLRSCKTGRFALSTLVLVDPAGGITYTLSGVVPSKAPDRAYDQTAGNKQYNLLYATCTES